MKYTRHITEIDAMYYAILIHQDDENGPLGVTIPDFPGCFTVADTWEDVQRSVQEAVEVHCEGEDMELPEVSGVKSLLSSPDAEGAVIAFVDIAVGKLDTKKERINISVPAHALREIDAYVEENHTTRSGFLVASALEALREKTKETA